MIKNFFPRLITSALNHLPAQSLRTISTSTLLRPKSANMITLYDIPSAAPGCAWSPNTWKVRYCLNLKNIPYKTEWLEYPDIAGRLQELGLPSTGQRPDGSPLYTLPAIKDDTTGIFMADSLPIAQYLETQYAHTGPSIFPHGTWGLQAVFREAMSAEIIPIRPFVVHAICAKLNKPAQQFYKDTREVTWNKAFDEIRPLPGRGAEEEWEKAKEGWSKVAEWYSGTSGPYLMGDTVSWADFVVCGQLIWYRAALGEDSKEWADIMSWDNGYWKDFCGAMKRYETVG
ncbi:hypothetical protein D9619_012609 [Psilocybe cf. subviscida]|uniref:GST N-terminal domain-containing protein n=1 Tax=Psilocybe cf. subviscida TaxID=2480587 RepID=A0A8H5B6P5_9AGAR|nr:hypothetical protein D9619_012609 [Psilocybe cf. subviscida]